MLVVTADTKTSAPGQLCFHVTGVNDHPPSLVNNTGVTVVQGGTALLNTQLLGRWSGGQGNRQGR